MKKSIYWPHAHNKVLRKILGIAKNGTTVIYIPGNRDELFRDHVGTAFGSIEIKREDIHVTKDGRSFLIMHGDEFDSAVQCNKLMGMIGNHAYDVLLALNGVVDFLRRKLGFPHWSLAIYIKHKVKNSVDYISRFENAVVYEAHKHNVDGLICGHIHRANLCTIDGVHYCNSGDWVESCTALVEHMDGELQILNWTERMHRNRLTPSQARKPLQKVA